jgi:hypothetical protein
MRITLEAIDFNPRANAAATDGLSIRVDMQTPVQPWTPGGGTSYAAYAMEPTRGRDLTIEATFSFGALPAGQSAPKVRATPAANASVILGEVSATTVPIPSASAPNTVVSLPLGGSSIWDAGVGRFEVSWRWQVQWTSSGPWTDFASSDHVVYVTLDRPNVPWTSDPATPQQFLWPWTTVLDWACAWAEGLGSASGAGLADSRRDAARRIEDAIFALGSRVTAPVIYGGAKFTDAQGRVFQLTEFVELLHGLPPVPYHSMNCSDCAAALQTFANAIGCNLSTHRLQHKNAPNALFATNPCVPIGKSPGAQGFTYHEFAVSEAGSDDKLPVYDGCLRVDFDTHPGHNPPADFQQPHGMTRGVLHNPQPIAYIQRLIADDTDVRSAHVALRAIDIPLGGAAPSDLLLGAWRRIRDRVETLAGPPGGPVHQFVTTPFVLPGFHVYESKPAPWQLALLEELRQSSQLLYVSAPGDYHSQQRLRVLVGFADTASLARDAFAWLLTQAHEALHEVAQIEPAPRGGVAFIASEETTAYVLRGQLVARISSEGTPLNLVDILRRVDAGFRAAIA